MFSSGTNCSSIHLKLNFFSLAQNNNVSNFLILQTYLLPFQSAYRSCHSTETTLLTLLNKTRLSADQGESTLLVSLDLSAAFDTIDHAILLDRLRLMYGVDGTALNWLRSYLTQRSQYVKVGQDISPSVLLSTGVPQGSVLGPILFTSFISPIQFVASHFKVDQQQYADDTQLFISISKTNSADQIRCLEAALLHLTSWFYHNCLALNPEKSEAILLGTHARYKTLSNINQVDIAGSPIPLSDKIKLLGVTIDSTLNFSKHVSLICQSCQYHIRGTSPHPTHPRCPNSSSGWACSGEFAARLRQLNLVWVAQVANSQASIPTECISPCCLEGELWQHQTIAPRTPLATHGI